MRALRRPRCLTGFPAHHTGVSLSPAPPRSWLPLLICAAVLVVLIVALHAPVFTRGALVTPAGMHFGQWPWKPYGARALEGGALLETNPTLSDLLFQIHPWQVHAARSFSTGDLPLWNPYSYCGTPFLANAQSALLYPLHWPAWMMGPQEALLALTAALLAKILLAGLFMAIYLRGLGLGAHACTAGGVAFALCGFMTSWLGYAHTNAAIFLPLLMHAARLIATGPGPAGFLIFVLAGAVQYLGGHPETSLHIVGASCLCFLWHARGAGRFGRRLAILCAAGAIGFAIAAVQMLPFIEYLLQSAQLASRQAGGTVDPALGPSALMMFLLPGYFGTPIDGTWSHTAAWQAVAGYAGAGTLLLALLSLRRAGEARFHQLLLAASLLVVLAPAWLRGLLSLIPVAGISSNNRLLLVVSFCLAALGAIELDAMARRRFDAPGVLADVGWLAAGATALLMAASTGLERDPPGVRTAFVVIAGTAVLAGLALHRPRMAPLHLWGIVAVISIDMLLFAAGFNPHADPDALFPSTPLIEFVRQDRASDPSRGGRIMTVGWTMRPETHIIHELPSIEGYDAMEFEDYRRTLDAAQVGAIHTTGVVPEASRPVLDDLGLRYLIAPPGAFVPAVGFAPAYDGPDGRVLINDAARRRFGCPGCAITVVRDDPGRMELEISSSGTARRLLISEAWDRGWRAAVDGTPAPVERVERHLMAVVLPAQGGRVELSYRPASFVAGAIISLAALAAAAAVGLRISPLL